MNRRRFFRGLLGGAAALVGFKATAKGQHHEGATPAVEAVTLHAEGATWRAVSTPVGPLPQFYEPITEAEVRKRWSAEPPAHLEYQPIGDPWDDPALQPLLEQRRYIDREIQNYINTRPPAPFFLAGRRAGKTASLAAIESASRDQKCTAVNEPWGCDIWCPMHGRVHRSRRNREESELRG